MATVKQSKNYSTNLDATIEILNRDAGVSATLAIRNVIDWINTLSVEGLIPVANQLEQLEDLLSAPERDAVKIADCMETLSKLTLEAASIEDGAQGDKIRELAYTLQRAAKVIRE
ncbi:hypothetical protein QNI19_15000 [Cytophagaceae bacterium DM2B3-1]|uniref:Uncharacterized protein n=2 Tax=Xanthocytophaga TaxID=3078918 RepID=A0ABT7CKI2_9BACT|nr:MULTISPECIES: hypothetical protein [Xanthocytophaga]MDJ1494249.1 hypothetical protein [Xanthocytophaga flavus]MDJ1503621.1 hypothetical protein [Xanthocytophaga agilis]